MRSAAVRALLCATLGLCGVCSGAAVAGTEVDPLGTVTSAISTIASQTTVASDLIGSATSATGDTAGSGATDGVSASGAIDGLSGSGDGSASSSDTDGGSASPSSRDSGSGTETSDSGRRTPHTRFDRLPRRYEILLERIESGTNVDRNLARLRTLLASASPELRRRIARLIRMEIRRLERGGLTRRERGAARRLRRLLTTLDGQVVRSAIPQPFSLERLADAGIPSGTVTHVAGVSASGASPTSGSAARNPTSQREGLGLGIPRLPLPPPGSPWALWPLLLVLDVIGGLFLFLVTAASRNSLPSPVRGIVTVSVPDVLAFTMVVVLGVVAAQIVVLLLSGLL
jgi:hypothetical protein